MTQIKIPYGDTFFTFERPEEGILAILEANELSEITKTSSEVIKDALESPFASERLEKIIDKNDTVAILVPDITRSWQSTNISVPILVEKLNSLGVSDSQITIIFATGTHRKPTPEEHVRLLGTDLPKRIKIIDHESSKKENLKLLGNTSRGIPVYINKHAVDADKVITVGGAIYHFMAGFGGGPKMVVPGIAGDETIQQNHKLALNPGLGNGRNPQVTSGNITMDNAVHADMVEAATFLKPDFSLYVVVDENYNITHAYAGDWLKAHMKACAICDELNRVEIPHPADLIIASTGGTPKDINLYQGIKAFFNAEKAANPGATIILLMKCPEMIGSDDFAAQICDFDNMLDREMALRNHFSIGAFIGYLYAEACENYNIILVSDLDPEILAHTKQKAVVKTLDEAMVIAKKYLGKKFREKAIVMPNGATTMPFIRN